MTHETFFWISMVAIMFGLGNIQSLLKKILEKMK